MITRNATNDDAARIAEIKVCSWRTAYRGMIPDTVLDALSIAKNQLACTKSLTDGTDEMLVIEDKRGVAGFAGFGTTRDADSSDCIELYHLYLDPSFYRQGIGRIFWVDICGRIAAKGHPRLAVWVLEANWIGRAFYQAMSGALDAGREKMFEVGGVKVPEVWYWCPTAGEMPRR